ncbi:MAG: hypothetical protein ACKVT0_13170 [Planctomycetaceae bacterium]
MNSFYRIVYWSGEKLLCWFCLRRASFNGDFVASGQRGKDFPRDKLDEWSAVKDRTNIQYRLCGPFTAAYFSDELPTISIVQVSPIARQMISKARIRAAFTVVIFDGSLRRGRNVCRIDNDNPGDEVYDNQTCIIRYIAEHGREFTEYSRSHLRFREPRSSSFEFLKRKRIGTESRHRSFDGASMYDRRPIALLLAHNQANFTHGLLPYTSPKEMLDRWY